MIRKTTAIFFILLANLILLAHAVVPHHHHASKFCVNTSHCQSNSAAHKHDSPAPDHEHDGDNGSEFCVLKQAVLIPSNQGYQFDKCVFDTNKPLLFPDFYALLLDNGNLPWVPKIISTTRPFLQTFSPSAAVSSSSGLRAPPVV